MPASVPPNIRRLVRRCLEKDAKRRLKDIGDACLEIEDALSPAGETPMPASATPGAVRPRVALGARRRARVRSSRRLRLAGWPAAGAPAAPRRVSAELGTDASLVTFQFGQGSAAILSPDGVLLAFVAEPAKAPRARSTSAPPRRVEGRTARGDRRRPQSVLLARRPMDCVFRRRQVEESADDWRRCGHDLRRPEQSGWCLGRGRPHHVLARSVRRTLVAGLRVGRQRPVPLTTLGENETTQRWPQMLRGGKAVLFTGNSRPDGFQEANVVVQSLPNGPRKVLVPGAYFGRYLASGHLVYVHDGTVFAAPFDLNRLELAGPAVPVLEGAAVNMPVGAAEITFSDAGTIAYLPAREQVNYMDAPSIGWIEAARPGRCGRRRRVGCILRFASDGRRLAFALFDGKQHDIWTYDWSRDPRRTDLRRRRGERSGVDAGRQPDCVPVPRGDGRDRKPVLAARRRRRRAPAPDQLRSRADPGIVAPRRKDSRVHGNRSVTGTPSIMMLRLDGDEVSGWRPAEPTSFLKDAEDPTFSPDGRWLAHVATAPGRGNRSLRPALPGPGWPRQISTDGGEGPVWSQTRRVLYGTPDNRIMAVSYSVNGDSFHAEKPRLLPNSRFTPRVVGRSFDLHPDGDRFALVKAPEALGCETRSHHCDLQFFRRAAKNRAAWTMNHVS